VGLPVDQTVRPTAELCCTSARRASVEPPSQASVGLRCGQRQYCTSSPVGPAVGLRLGLRFSLTVVGLRKGLRRPDVGTAAGTFVFTVR